MTRGNEWGQPIGEPLEGWSPPTLPHDHSMVGRYVRLLPLSREHSSEIYEAFRDASKKLWTYMGFDPFDSLDDVDTVLTGIIESDGWVPYAAESEGVVRGFASYLRVDPPAGVLEIGSIFWSPAMQRTPASTEAVTLMLSHAFEIGYRRVEWKCDSFNEPSRRAAERFGFEYEGTFRKATHYKGRNRDTAWYSMTDDEWPSRRSDLETWLDPSNFDDGGRQRRSLSEIRAGKRT